MHPLVSRRAEQAQQRSLGHVLAMTAQVDGVLEARVFLQRGRWQVRCRISRWWWLLLGLKHLVVRRMVRRRIARELGVVRYMAKSGGVARLNLRNLVESVVVT